MILMSHHETTIDYVAYRIRRVSRRCQGIMLRLALSRVANHELDAEARAASRKFCLKVSESLTGLKYGCA